MTFGPTIRNGVSVSVGSTPSLGGNVLNIPAQIGSIAAWYRYGQGITQAGGFASAWADQSGNNRPLLQGTGAAQPAVQADNSLLFNGTSHFMRATFTLNQPTTVCLLGRMVTWTTGDRAFDGSTANTGSLQQVSGSPQVRLLGSSGTSTNTNWTLNTYAAVVCVINNGSGNCVIRVNNTAEQSSGDIATATGMGGITLAASGAAASFGNLQVKEVVVFATGLTLTQRARMVQYLAAVGGLSV